MGRRGSWREWTHSSIQTQVGLKRLLPIAVAFLQPVMPRMRLKMLVRTDTLNLLPGSHIIGKIDLGDGPIL